MHSISDFMNARADKARARQEHQLQRAVVNRDVMGPDYTRKGRKRDLQALRAASPKPMTDDMGRAFGALGPNDIGSGPQSKQKKKALPKYNATRPPGQR